MTPVQIFLAYAKLRDIIPHIHKMALDTRMMYTYDTETRRYERNFLKFGDIVKNHFNFHGFGDNMFINLLYQYPYGGDIIDKPEVNRAMRLWNGFVSKNIKCDEGLKIGSEIKFDVWGTINCGKIISISKDFGRIRVECLDGRTMRINPGSIKEVDGKPFEPSFYFKWKGKEYGKK